MADDSKFRASGRPRIPLVPAPLWAKTLAKNAVKTVAAEFSNYQARQEEHAGEEGDAFSMMRERVLAFLLRKDALKSVDPEWVVRWLDRHGEDVWLNIMTRWERVSREVVDELLNEPKTGRTTRTAEYYKRLERWEGAATMVIGKIIHLRMETPEARRARRYNAAKKR